MLALAVAALALILVAPAFAVDCDGITLPDGCLFTTTGGHTADPDDGFAVTNAAGVLPGNMIPARSDHRGLGPNRTAALWTNGLDVTLLGFGSARTRCNA